jgi:predicted phage terminase large subunit-like protein
MYQGNPTPGTGSIFLTKWWRRYDTVLWTRKEGGAFDVPGYELTQSWDMTFKDTKGTDFVVGGLIAKKGADSFLIYVMRARLDFTSTIQEFERMCRLFPRSRAKYIEEKANGAAVINVLKKKIPGLIAINPTESKTSRAEAGSVYVRSGNIWLPTKEIAAETPELAWDVEGFINEHTAFDKGTHDDQVDMLSQYINEKYIHGGTARISSPVGTGPKPRVTPPAVESEIARRIREKRSA